MFFDGCEQFETKQETGRTRQWSWRITADLRVKTGAKQVRSQDKRWKWRTKRKAAKIKGRKEWNGQRISKESEQKKDKESAFFSFMMWFFSSLPLFCLRLLLCWFLWSLSFLLLSYWIVNGGIAPSLLRRVAVEEWRPMGQSGAMSPIFVQPTCRFARATIDCSASDQFWRSHGSLDAGKSIGSGPQWTAHPSGRLSAGCSRRIRPPNGTQSQKGAIPARNHSRWSQHQWPSNKLKTNNKEPKKKKRK